MARAEKMIRLQTLWDILNEHKVATNVTAQAEVQRNSLDAAPVTHARWRHTKHKISTIMCSFCWGEVKAEHELNYHFCPFCGARMDLRARKVNETHL